ncbi:MAG: helix-turn-helix transcriptional regulator [Aristaeellaceae bacterium]
MKKPKSEVRNRLFARVCSLVCLLTTLLLLAVYGFLTIQRLVSLRERMGDGADLLAVRVQDKLSSIQGASMYLASLDSVNTLLTQRNPSLSVLSEYNDVLCSVSGNELDIELLFHKSQKILTSDYGLSTYDAYLDQAFLTSLLESSRQPEKWLLRSYRKTMFSEAKMVLSHIRSLPLSSVQNNGCLIVSLPLSSLAKTAAAYADRGLGDYAVWLEDELLLASSADASQAQGAQICSSSVETAVRAAYWMSTGTLLRRSLPSPLLFLGAWLLAMLLCAVTAHIICHQRIARLDVLLQEMSTEWPPEEGDEDQVDQLRRMFESLSLELAHARQTTRDGLPLLQERLIGELLRTPVPIAEKRESLERCGIHLNNPFFAVVQAAMKDGAFDGELYLLVRRQVQTQLATLGEVHSTYGDGSSILFLVNATEYASLSERLETLCETMHDALKSFLSVEVVFSIGLCAEDSATLHNAYIAARDQLLTLRMMDEPPQDAVVLARPNQTALMPEEMVQQVCGAVIAQDAAALEAACGELCGHYLPAELSLKELSRHATVFLMRVCASLTESSFLFSQEAAGAVMKQLPLLKSAAEVHAALQEWCRSLLRYAQETSEDTNHYVEAALKFIHDNYMRSLNVPDIGEAVNVNPIYLNRLFKSATGNTLSNYLNQYRCEHARAMLEETQATVNEISDACGFSEIRSFIRFFKKYYEETPTEYRKRIRGRARETEKAAADS